MEGKLKNNPFDKLHSWICNHPQVVNPPLKNNHVNIKDHITGEIIKRKKLLIKTPVKKLHKDLIKKPSEGGFRVPR